MLRIMLFMWFVISVPGWMFTQAFLWRQVYFDISATMVWLNIAFVITNALSVALLIDSQKRR